jgi:hypothetical protein
MRRGTTPSRKASGQLICLGFSLLCACGPKAGEEDSEILAPFESLAGGVVYATRAIPGSDGYDLWWSPVPLAGTPERVPYVRLTETRSDDWQPSVSAGGGAIAFARAGEGIFLITESGRIKRISDTAGTQFKDSLPAVSYDGVKVAWVREDFGKPYGDTGWVDTYIMIANFDGSDARPVEPREGAIQDAPVFEPIPRSNQLAWSEFSVATIGAGGPQDYGIRIHDHKLNTGRYLCQNPAIVVDGFEMRCFGQHLAWPVQNAIVQPQQFLEIYPDGSNSTTVLGQILDGIFAQQAGVPETTPAFSGFHRPFPLSASYDGLNRMIFDGLVGSVEGDLPTLGFFVAGVDGGGLWRLNIQDYFSDYDLGNTANYFFSVATPQLIPVPAP